MDVSRRQQYYLDVIGDPGGGGGSGGGGAGGGERPAPDRLPQWSHAETRVFLAVRAELDRTFLETKRNRHLWAAVSSRMAEKGFHRTPDQCKCKWKNLVTRYKGCEAVEGDGGRQFPFYEDMKKIFADRMERLLRFEESKEQGMQALVEGEEASEPWAEERGSSRKRRRVGGGGAGAAGKVDPEKTLREFMAWQTQMDARRLRAFEAREAERREREMEWRRAMEALAMERAALDKRWRDREEERWAREEARAERRHALVTAILNKLAGSGP